MRWVQLFSVSDSVCLRRFLAEKYLTVLSLALLVWIALNICTPFDLVHLKWYRLFIYDYDLWHMIKKYRRKNEVEQRRRQAIHHDTAERILKCGIWWKSAMHWIMILHSWVSIIRNFGISTKTAILEPRVKGFDWKESNAERNLNTQPEE